MTHHLTLEQTAGEVKVVLLLQFDPKRIAPDRIIEMLHGVRWAIEAIAGPRAADEAMNQARHWAQS